MRLCYDRRALKGSIGHRSKAQDSFTCKDSFRRSNGICLLVSRSKLGTSTPVNLMTLLNYFRTILYVDKSYKSTAFCPMDGDLCSTFIFLRNGIIAMPTPGMAAKNSFGGKPHTFDDAPLFNRLNGVVGASWLKTT